MSVEIVTDDLKREQYRVEGAIQATPRQMRTALGKAIKEVQSEAVRYARSGGAFSRRSTGMLARSLGSTVVGDNLAILTVGVAYGLIQDRGGVTSPHIIRAKNGQALVFPWDKFNNVFAMKRGSKRRIFSMMQYSASAALRAGIKVTGLAAFASVNHPGSRIPPKHYARHAFESAKPQVEWVLKNAAKETIGGKA